MSQTIQQGTTTKERLAIIETVMNAMVESNMKFENAVMEGVRRIEVNQKEIERKLNDHLQEPYVNYKDTKKKLMYEILRYLIFIFLGIGVAYIGEILGGK
jgi:hypothetical protein